VRGDLSPSAPPGLRPAGTGSLLKERVKKVASCVCQTRPPQLARDIDVHTYTEGTLIVDLIDAKEEQLVWRGSGTGVVGNQEKIKEKAGEAIQKILADFPPQ
jgi:hypothetical protein